MVDSGRVREILTERRGRCDSLGDESDLSWTLSNEFPQHPSGECPHSRSLFHKIAGHNHLSSKCCLPRKQCQPHCLCLVFWLIYLPVEPRPICCLLFLTLVSLDTVASYFSLPGSICAFLLFPAVSIWHNLLLLTCPHILSLFRLLMQPWLVLLSLDWSANLRVNCDCRLGFKN